MVDLVDIILARHDLGPEPEPEPLELATLGPTAKKCQFALVSALNEARAAVDILQSFVVECPERDDLISAGSENLGRVLVEAGDALDRFRALRDCVGEA